MATMYSYENTEDGLHTNIFKGSFEWDNEDITPANCTPKPPIENTNIFKEVFFNTETDEWELRDNPYQIFTHKYVPSLDFKNNLPALVSQSGYTSFSKMKTDISQYPDEWVVGVERPSYSEIEGLTKLGAVCKIYWSDEEQKFVVAEPFLSDVITHKRQKINSECSTNLTQMKSSVTGTEYTYCLDSNTRQNLTDLIEFLETTNQGSGLFRCTDSEGVKENRPHTLEQLKQLQTDIQEYKMNLLNTCSELKVFMETLTDIEDVYYLQYSDIEEIRAGNYVPYTQREGYQKPDWRQQDKSAKGFDFEKTYNDILKREGLL